MKVYDEIICCNCSINAYLDEFKIKIEDLDEYPKIKVVGYGEEDTFVCKECGEELEALDMYFTCEDDLKIGLTIIVTAIANVLSDEIEHCSHCEGRDLQDYEVRAEKEKISYQSSGIDIADFLCNMNVPDDIHAEIMPKLRCNCGYGEGYHPKQNPDNGHFDYSDRIYKSEEIHEFWGGFEERLIEVAQIYGVIISMEQIDDFVQHCFDNPMLAYKHNLAKLIFDVLNKVLEKKANLSVQIGESLFRGRCRAKDNKKFEVGNLGMPPKGLASHGRYNLVGTSVLYLTDDKMGIPYEIEPKKNEVIDVAEYQVQQELVLFDVDAIFGDFSLFINRENNESTLVKRNYLFTNFLASVCNEVGFDGVYYKGAGDKPYNNIAIFEKAVTKLQEQSTVETVDCKIKYDFV
ncbi:hypothetical protein COK37_21045 [Bacillus thuringiensis]|uniref:hypothetical protein n=1 Tax=Bacillus thuringiensis TaxID=1428 RepID=UPI000BF40AE5|nr:hypothetical protein [Bacillus thuringiensis]PEV50746.1 hypothetical protein CN432_09060 [Bacillus thuringiensis]PFR65837.1 hypothetical protein COK37_21045 [Bacillus thuringiensis]PFT77436.1 hypothetical protein COK70_19820 [Bacillus thuringiensis]PFV87918.1 hypothetical protein COL06_15100 [Bacillus thuringiensis]